MSEIADMKKQMDSGANPRDFKLRLAYEITKTFLGDEGATQGQENFKTVIQDKDKPEDIPKLKPSAYDIVSILVEAKFCKSKSEARQQIAGGGVRVNDVKVETYDYLTKSGDTVQKGKRFFVNIL
jgi:tyrosyl-tRNA synthetase